MFQVFVLVDKILTRFFAQQKLSKNKQTYLATVASHHVAIGSLKKLYIFTLTHNINTNKQNEKTNQSRSDKHTDLFGINFKMFYNYYLQFSSDKLQWGVETEVSIAQKKTKKIKNFDEKNFLLEKKKKTSTFWQMHHFLFVSSSSSELPDSLVVKVGLDGRRRLGGLLGESPVIPLSMVDEEPRKPAIYYY